jgi:hypothetical protein
MQKNRRQKSHAWAPLKEDIFTTDINGSRRKMCPTKPYK